jgi:hypothetical protein
MPGSAACGLEERQRSDEVPPLEPDGPGGNAGGPEGARRSFDRARGDDGIAGARHQGHPATPKYLGERTG